MIYFFELRYIDYSLFNPYCNDNNNNSNKNDVLIHDVSNDYFMIREEKLIIYE